MIRVPVAVHRWFERGEGWAYDPLCAARCGPDVAGTLNALLDCQLKQPEAGGFLLRGEDGVWLGWIEPDRAGLDPHLPPGEVPILRAGFLPYAPDGDLEERVLAELRRRSPRQPGEDASLTLEVVLGDEAPATTRPRRSLRVPAWVPVVAALSVLGLVLGVLTRPWSFFSFGASGKPHVRKMIGRLRQWGDTTFDDSDATRTGPVVSRFFDFLSRPSWSGRLDADAHPYHAFPLRLPEEPIRPGDPGDESSVRLALGELLDRLGWSVPGGRRVELDELLDNLDRAMTYEDWWRSSGRWRRYRRLDAPLGAEMSDFVDRFRRPEPEVVVAAEKMLELLSRWQVSGLRPADARRHPDQVAAVFFRLLCKKDFTYRQLRPNHPDTVFVDRLPEEPADGGRPMVTAAEWQQALHELLRYLDVDATASSDLARCVERIGRAMDFGHWRQTAGQREYPDVEQRIDESVRDFARRFK
jgi:hypothetical protein